MQAIDTVAIIQRLEGSCRDADSVTDAQIGPPTGHLDRALPNLIEVGR
jgi:hypothetical protein